MLRFAKKLIRINSFGNFGSVLQENYLDSPIARSALVIYVFPSFFVSLLLQYVLIILICTRERHRPQSANSFRLLKTLTLEHCTK